MWNCVKGFPVVKEHSTYVITFFMQDACAIDQLPGLEHQQLIYLYRTPIDEQVK